MNRLLCGSTTGLPQASNFNYKQKTIMSKNEKIARLESQLSEWTAKLNRSRKNSLIAMRALHVNAIRKELEALKESDILIY